MLGSAAKSCVGESDGCCGALTSVVEVHKEREANKMDLKALTVVLSPNLWQLPPQIKDPLEVIRNFENVERAMHTLCRYACALHQST